MKHQEIKRSLALQGRNARRTGGWVHCKCSLSPEETWISVFRRHYEEERAWTRLWRMGRQKSLVSFHQRGWWFLLLWSTLENNSPVGETRTLRELLELISPEWVFDYCLFTVESDVLPITCKIGFWESKWSINTGLKNNLDKEKPPNGRRMAPRPSRGVWFLAELIHTVNERSTFPRIWNSGQPPKAEDASRDKTWEL